MQNLDRSILATLAYAGAQRHPLTAIEVHERLIPPERVGGAGREYSLTDTVLRLDALAKTGGVVTELGLYALAGTSTEQFWSRMDRQKEAAAKWRRMRRYARALRFAPFTEALWVSGALAQSVAAPQSDWDIFVLARAGRLYTARVFLLALAFITGRLRTKHSVIVRDRFCFNQYLTTDSMSLRHHSLYVAQAIARFVPLADESDWLGRFWDANAWMKAYVPMPRPPMPVRRRLGPSRTATAFRRAMERMLGGRVGDFFERAVRAWMLRRIEADPATHAPGGRIVADDRELEFHPRSQEASILDSYNRTVARLIPGVVPESDSGLKH